MTDDQITQIREQLTNAHRLSVTDSRGLLALVDQLRQEQCPREHANLEGLIQRIGMGGFAGPVPDDGQDVALLAHIIHGESQRAAKAEAACARLRTALEALPHYSEAEVGRLPSTLNWVLVDDLEAALSLPSEGSRQ